jgi:hypothetical protein
LLVAKDNFTLFPGVSNVSVDLAYIDLPCQLGF